MSKIQPSGNWDVIENLRSECEILQTENELLRKRIVDLKNRITELEDKNNLLLWDVFNECWLSDKNPGWTRPMNSREIEACVELEELGKLEKHPTKDLWRKKKVNKK